MIKAVILDVDGVIVGEKIGFNSPYPHADVMARLAAIETRGIPISLCTAKPHYSIWQIISGANLHNPHITDGGSVIIDPIDHIIVKTHVIDPGVAKEVVQMYLDAGVYVEAYTVDEYFVQASQQRPLTETHTHILQTAPHIVDSLVDEIDRQDIVKIMPVARDEAEKEALKKLFQPFDGKLTLSWGVHPIALPHQFGIITAPGISKQQAAVEIAKAAGIGLHEILGVGDSTSDWQFMEQCGYAGTLSNGPPELKDLVRSKGVQEDKRAFVSETSVDQNGILDIFDYFGL